MVRFALGVVAVSMWAMPGVVFGQGAAGAAAGAGQVGVVTASAVSATAAAQAAGVGGPVAGGAAADPTMGVTFDVVSIRHTGQGPSRVTNSADGDGITLTNSTMREIVQWNYKVGSLRGDQIEHAPEWFSSMDENYEIHAKVAAEDVAAWQKLDDEARRLVFRKMLADRFKLACHLVEVEAPVYDLVIAKGGLKMKEAKPGEVNSGNFKVLGDPNKPYSGYEETRDRTPGGARAVFQRMDMASFAKWEAFSYAVGRPVVDKTGLTGVYNFSLDFSWQPMSAAPAPMGSAPELTGPDIFTALQQQLGLKLESARGPMSHVVIDHIERPSEN